MKVGVVERRGQGMEWRGMKKEESGERVERESEENKRRRVEKEGERRKEEEKKQAVIFFPFHRANLFLKFMYEVL